MNDLPRDDRVYELLPRILFKFEPQLEITQHLSGGPGQFRVADFGDLWLDGIPPHAVIHAESRHAEPPGGGPLRWPIEPMTTAGLRAAVRDALRFLRAAAPDGRSSE